MRTLTIAAVAALAIGAAVPALAEEVGTREGQVHPDFSLPDLDGKLTRLSSFRGRKVLLFHFASW